MRLSGGDFTKITRYGADAQEISGNYLAAGAKRLHVIFLWGAQTGKLTEEEKTLRSIIKTRDIYDRDCRIQIGGGIRRYGQVENFIGQGIDFIIIGTSLLIPVVLEEGFSKNDLKLFYQRGGKDFSEEKEIPEFDLISRIEGEVKEKIIVAVDYRKDETALSGWEVSVPLTPHYMIKKLMEKGYRKFLITNVERDGMLEGIDTASVKNILEKISRGPDKPAEVISAGGITSEADIEALQKLGRKPDGVVIGKALYSKKIDLRAAIKKFQ
ncbi:MAG: hypothetical protein JW957_09180 [Candidatus Omnitrophica bacterium]|nr:hypothetical protein [Candidatus Omnitrophota bacterium]